MSPEILKAAEVDIRNFLDLHDAEQAELCDAILAFGERVRLVVHPYHLIPQQWYRDDRRLNEVTAETDQLLSEPDGMPVICLVGKSTVDRFETRARKLSRTPLYVVETHSEDPRPFLDTGDGWSLLSGKLKAAGVKNLLVSGMFLHAPLNGCVGDTVRALRTKFSVEISPSCFPETPESLQIDPLWHAA